MKHIDPKQKYFLPVHNVCKEILYRYYRDENI